jgi:hypothetical protein
MSQTVNIKRGDLHLALSAAFTRGRYVLMTDGEGRPLEITVDLKERPDDLFEGEGAGLHPWMTDGERAEAFVADDHGPAIPAQGQPGPIVYEFALQDTAAYAVGFGLEKIVAPDAPDAAACHAADWVHVFDRVTRERRTLKRPAPDAILTGLQDVSADLRAIDRKGEPNDT